MQATLQKPGMLFDIHHPHPGLGIRHQNPLEQSQAGWGYWDVCGDGIVPSHYLLSKGGVPSWERVLTVQHGIQNDAAGPDVSFLQGGMSFCEQPNQNSPSHGVNAITSMELGMLPVKGAGGVACRGVAC